MKGIISNRLTKTIAVFCIAALMQCYSGSILSADLSTTNLRNIDAPELEYMIDSGSKDYLLIDVRDRPDFDRGHIPTAISIPHNEIEKHLFEIPKDKLVILYCKAGKIAGIASTKLKEFGYEKVITFGTDYWPYDLEDNTGKIYSSLDVREGSGSCEGRSSADQSTTNLRNDKFTENSNTELEHNSNLEETILDKMHQNGKVQLDIFIMSQCPFVVQPLKQIIPIVKRYGDKIDFNVNFIATVKSDGSFTSVHGQSELDEDIRQTIMQEYYPEQYLYYILARIENYASDDWEISAINAGIDPEEIESLCSADEAKMLFKENINIGKRLHISASPTLLVEGELYKGRFDKSGDKVNGLCYIACGCSGGSTSPVTCIDCLGADGNGLIGDSWSPPDGKSCYNSKTKCNGYGCTKPGTVPVELSSFTAECVNDIAVLHWTTQSERDNIGWNIFRSSKNNDNFVNAAQINNEMIAGYGSTSEPHYYIYEDEIENTEVGDTYYYWLESIDYSGISQVYNRVAQITIPDPSVNPPQIELPVVYDFKNVPNPVSTSSQFQFALDTSALVSVSIYNVRGELVRMLPSILTNEDETATIYWNGKDNSGKELSPGVYFYNLIVNGKIAETKKLILMK